MVSPSVYTCPVPRVQIDIDDELDKQLQAEARKLGTSKESLVRRALAQRYDGRLDIAGGSMSQLVGRFDVEPSSVDDVVYPS